MAVVMPLQTVLYFLIRCLSILRPANKTKHADQVRSLPLLCAVLVQSRREDPHAMAQSQAAKYVVWEQSCDISGCHHEPN